MKKGITGWLCPEGKFYPCRPEEHRQLASELYGTTELGNRYVYISNGIESCVIIFDNLTEEQKNG